jgi:hypothetical protein
MTPLQPGARMAERLDALLREQRDALREGRLDALESVAVRLDRAIRALGRDLPPDAAARLRDKAARNARLLGAALSGLSDMRALREDAQRARLTTYDASGRLRSSVTRGQDLSRR